MIEKAIQKMRMVEIMDMDGCSVRLVRQTHDDTWEGLVEMFFDGLRGLGYGLPSNTAILDAIEDARTIEEAGLDMESDSSVFTLVTDPEHLHD